MPQATLTPLPPTEAIAALDRRGLRLDPTFSWADAWEADHAAMFTVAKSTGFDVLKDIHAGLRQALAEGRTFESFARDLRPTLEAKGWWGRKEVTDSLNGEISERQLGSPRRLRTIFDTNMRVSYAAGHWSRFERQKATRPFLRYVAILDGRERPSHRARHNLCLPVDDPYWDTWAPPCGWGCRCTLQSLSERDVSRMRGELVFKPPPNTARFFVNQRTGDVATVPDGIDPGWGYNPGKAGWRASPAAEKLIASPPSLAAAAVAAPTWPTRQIAEEYAAWFDEAIQGGALDPARIWVGTVGQDVLDALGSRGMGLVSGAITLNQRRLNHGRRPDKRADLRAVPDEVLRRLPDELAAPRAVLLDRRDISRLLYVFDVPGERDGVAVIEVNVSRRMRQPTGGRATVTSNEILTTGLVARSNLADPNAYELLSGSL